MKYVLHVGCSFASLKDLPGVFQKGWSEIRLDIDESVSPDVVASMLDMSIIESGSVDAVFSSHNIEHLYPHEVSIAFAEFRRVLKADGFLLVRCPNMEAVARAVVERGLDAPLYESGVGPISAIDIMYGHRASIEAGNLFMAHKTGFTPNSLRRVIGASGFAQAIMAEDSLYGLHALACLDFCSDDEMHERMALYI